MSKKELPFLGLTIILKNEEKVIARMLETVAPLIDWYTIVDTGSTDRTKEICKEIMDKHGIPGEIVDHEWTNFCGARNAAIEAARGKCQWGFWIDADEQLIWPKDKKMDIAKFRKYLEQVDCASISVDYGSQTYFRTQFYKIDYPWEWRGAVHEVLLTKKDKDEKPLAPPPRSGRVEGITVLVTPDGASWGDGSRETQQKKYGDHAELLLEYIKTDSDVRWLFYLAQSYRDSFNWPKAEEWYAKRAREYGRILGREIFFSINGCIYES